MAQLNIASATIDGEAVCWGPDGADFDRLHSRTHDNEAILIAFDLLEFNGEVVCDIPLLFERHMTDRFDRILLVDAERPVRLERLVTDRDLRETEAMEMIAAQMPAELKRARADFVIENNGALSALEARVNDVWSALLEEAEATALL